MDTPLTTGDNYGLNLSGGFATALHHPHDLSAIIVLQIFLSPWRRSLLLLVIKY